MRSTEYGLTMLDAFRNVNSKMSVQWIAAVLYIASRPAPGPIAKEVGAFLGMESGAVTWMIAALSKAGVKHDGNGADLIYGDRDDPLDHRAKHLRLTPKGERILRGLEVSFRQTCRELQPAK